MPTPPARPPPTTRSRPTSSKLDGAPLGQRNEFSGLDLQQRDAQGNLVIPDTAHVRLAAPETNNGAVILRRAFSYNNGTTPFVERWPPWRQALEYDAGLLFLAYQKDPRRAFVPIFSRLAEADASTSSPRTPQAASSPYPPEPPDPPTGSAALCSADPGRLVMTPDPDPLRLSLPPSSSVARRSSPS